MPGEITIWEYLSEDQIQQVWYDRIGKFLGFPKSGADALWPKNSERYGGDGTTIWRLFSGDAEFKTKTWLGYGDGLQSTVALPLMTRTVADTRKGVVFLAGLYGVNEAMRSYLEKGGKEIKRGKSLRDLTSAYKLVNPNIEPDPVPEDQTRLEDYDKEVSWAKDEMESFKKPTTNEGELVISDQEKRMELMLLLEELQPDNLFNTTQTDVLGKYGNTNWIILRMFPPKDKHANIHYDKYVADGFVKFDDYADNLIKFLDRQITFGHESLIETNKIFKKIVEEGPSQGGATGGAFWMIRPPNNNKQMMLALGQDEQLPLQKTFFSPIKKSTVNWKNILKSKMSPSPPPEDDEEEAKKVKDKFTTNKWGQKIINPSYRRAGDTFIIDGEEVTEGTWKDTPLGQRLGVTSNWEDSCCQELKESLIKLLTVEIKRTNRDIHKDKIRQTVASMHCSELSEYMEPPEVDQNNFHNLQFFGIKIGDLSQEVFMDALDLSGDIHRVLYEKYVHCLDYNVQWGVKKPPSETTDPVKDKVDVESGDVIVEREVPEHREFEGFTYDTNTKPGELTDDEKSFKELQREAIIHGKRKDMDDPRFQEDLMVQPMQEKWWEQQQAERNKPSKEKFTKLWKYGRKKTGNLNLSTTSLNIKKSIPWGDAQVMQELKFTDVEWNYTFDNWEELYDEYI